MPSRVAIDALRRQMVKVCWEGSVLTEIEPQIGVPLDFRHGFVAPGLVDAQINGLAGINFGDPLLTIEQIHRTASLLARHGVTHFLPTLITDSVARMSAAVAKLAEGAEDPGLLGAILGLHLEGPYLSPVDGPRGAHPLEHCKLPDWDEFQRLQERARGWIKVMTLAPELPGAISFIEKATLAGVRIAIGHTAASRREILAAVDAGATLATHLGNAAFDQMQRHHNTIFDQLGEDRLHASLIVDGHHLPPHVVKIFARAKGLERVLLVSDAVQYAGLPPGIYDGGYRQFEVRADGFIGVVGEPRLAGSGLLLSRAVENFTRFCDEETTFPRVANVTTVPRRWLGIAEPWESVGGEASLVFFDWDGEGCQLSIRETLRRGEVVYRA